MSLCVRVKKSFPGFCLEADFTCDAGMLALLGASGSGKTLTLNCVAGVQKPDEGHIELDGKVLFDSKGQVKSVHFPTGQSTRLSSKEEAAVAFWTAKNQTEAGNGT
ncbi:MAG: ATP-binding cassette domain-containing protein, partial [Clostridia bacterium]